MNGTVLSIPPLVSTLLIFSAKATVLLALALTLRTLLRRTSASTRYYLISATVILAAGLPVLSYVVPDRELPLPAVIQSHVPESLESIPTWAGGAGDRAAQTAGNIAAASELSPPPTPAAAANLLVYLWLMGTVVTAGRVLCGWAGCARRRRAATPLTSGPVGVLVDAAVRRIGLRRRVTVLVGNTEVPHVGGVFRPVLFLPRDVLKWPRQRLMSVLVHEHAHVRRGDHITWPLANLAISWMWFNPLAWLALAVMKKDRERACDDYVLSTGGDNVNYARHLLEACLSSRTSTGLVPVNLQFARKNDVKERIKYMLSHRVDRRPVSRTRQFSLTLVLVLIAVPLISISGFSTTPTLTAVAPAERDAIVATLDAFYAEMSAGSDYQLITDRFLTSDYFDDPNLTFENLDEAVWRPVFDNTLLLIQESGVGVAREVRSRIVSIHREREEVIVTQQVDVIADRVHGAIVHEDEDGNMVIRRDPSLPANVAMEDCRLVNSLSLQIRLRREDGFWKISRYDDGIAVMRMDTDTPHGPIFLVWIEDIDSQTTPFGPGIFKVIPRDVVPDARNTRFLLEK